VVIISFLKITSYLESICPKTVELTLYSHL